MALITDQNRINIVEMEQMRRKAAYPDDTWWPWGCNVVYESMGEAANDRRARENLLKQPEQMFLRMRAILMAIMMR